MKLPHRMKVKRPLSRKNFAELAQALRGAIYAVFK
jgi:hypothetical protein